MGVNERLGIIDASKNSAASHTGGRKPRAKPGGGLEAMDLWTS